MADKDQLTSLALDLRFDDGFIAYLNGREVARANFAEDFVRPQPQWDSFAGNQVGTGSTAGAANRVAEALDVVTFDLTPYLPELVNGTNVLAFHGVNSNSTSSSSTNRLDFFIEPVLTATRATRHSAGYVHGGADARRRQRRRSAGLRRPTRISRLIAGSYAAPIPAGDHDGHARCTDPLHDRRQLPRREVTGTLYTGPINITTTTILRAIAYKTGYTSTNVDTRRTSS